MNFKKIVVPAYFSSKICLETLVFIARKRTKNSVHFRSSSLKK